MVIRTLHPIFLAGALLALPAVAAWAPRGKGGGAPAEAEVRTAATPPATAGATLIPVEVVEAGGHPVRRFVEIQTVPEPSALLLLLPSALLVWFRRR